MSWRGRILFYSQLKQLLVTGMPLSECVPMAAAAAHPYRDWSQQLAAGCAAGRPLGEQLAECGESKLAAALVSAGEHSGRLPDLIDEIIGITEHAIQTRSMVISRAIYPLVLVHAAMMIPALVPVILGKAAVWTVLIGPLLLWAGAAAAWTALKLGNKSGMGAQLALRPPLRALTAHLCSSASCLVLHASATAGMLWPAGLRMAAEACGNRVWGKRLSQAAEDIEQERLPDLTAAFKQCQYPPDIINLVATGEKSGQTEESLRQAATIERERFTGRVQWTARVVMGVVYGIGLLVAAIAVIMLAMEVYIQPMRDVMNDMP